MILLMLTGVCMLTVFGAMAYIDRSGRSRYVRGGYRAGICRGARRAGTGRPAVADAQKAARSGAFLPERSSAGEGHRLSGAQGADEAYTKAYVMAKYLIEQGVDENRVIQEEQAHDTRENLGIPRARRAARHGYSVCSHHHE